MKQYKQYASLDAGIRIALDRLDHLEQQAQQNGKDIEDIDATILSEMGNWAIENKEDHERTQCAIEGVSLEVNKNSQEVISLAATIIDNFQSALDKNRKQHWQTFQTVMSRQEEMLDHIDTLGDEIRRLRTQVQQSVQNIAAATSIGEDSLEKEQMLQNANTAKHTLLAAKELVWRNMAVSTV